MTPAVVVAVVLALAFGAICGYGLGYAEARRER